MWHYWGIWNETDWETAWGLQQEGREAAQRIQNRENGSAKAAFSESNHPTLGRDFYCCWVHSREGDVDGVVIVSHFWKVSTLVIVLCCLMAESVPFWMGNCIEILKQWQQIITRGEFQKGSSPLWLETSSSSSAGHLCFSPSILSTGLVFTSVVGAPGTTVGWQSISVSCFPIREARE